MTSSAPIIVRVDRLLQVGQATVSAIYVDGEFICWGLEDVFREEKVRKVTRIPAGWYDLERRFSGRHFRRYNKAYNHKSTLWVRRVPNFSWIMLHAGNLHTHTDGCLLTGTKVLIGGDGSLITEGSVTAYRKLYSLISKGIDKRGARIWYRDLDRHAAEAIAFTHAVTSTNCRCHSQTSSATLRA